jgi:hypothetical protein
MKLLHKYTNGNYTVQIFNDGTKIRETNEDDFIATFPENIDIKISDKCDIGCNYCHENSTIDGQVASFNEEFLYSLKPGTELAIGGGNIFENEDLKKFLSFCKMNGILANITVNQNHMKGSFHKYNNDNKKHYWPSEATWKIFDWLDYDLVHGIGISYNGDSEDLDNMFDSNINQHWQWNQKTLDDYKSHCVIHVINGVHSYNQIMKLANKGYKLLILGYKDLRRGHDYLAINQEDIKNKQDEIYKNIHKIIESFKVVSFDNLAIEQLNIRRLFTTESWEQFYMGDDGNFTMYIDLVKKEFAKNSTSLRRYKLLPTIEEMFNVFKNDKAV